MEPENPFPQTGLIKKVQDTIEKASIYGLQYEVIAEALKTMETYRICSRDITPEMALEIGYDEWIK
jgi:hypothetical protein